MFRLIFGLAGIALLVAAFIYLAPDTWKEWVIEIVNKAPVVPEPLRKKIEDALSTPHYRRTKLIEELEKNLGALAQEFQATAQPAVGGAEQTAPSPSAEHAKQIIEESQKLIETLKQENAESPAIGTAAKKLIEKIVEEQLGSKSTQCATSTTP